MIKMKNKIFYVFLLFLAILIINLPVISATTFDNSNLKDGIQNVIYSEDTIIVSDENFNNLSIITFAEDACNTFSLDAKLTDVYGLEYSEITFNIGGTLKVGVIDSNGIIEISYYGGEKGVYGFTLIFV
ncbi:hypothetical protein [Methanobrevibacter sp. DSM 116169]|uniref:hypothetical protein n=1 Tax=Methanobrevibacter sp. DSM 116169 TaxID=3242727 RepID=UPI0038FC07DF